jgi:hypothetical protein
MRDGIFGDWEWFISFLPMKSNSLENTGREGYTAPKCRMFAFCVEGCITLGSPEPGEPSSPDSYNDYEDD